MKLQQKEEEEEEAEKRKRKILSHCTWAWARSMPHGRQPSQAGVVGVGEATSWGCGCGNLRLWTTHRQWQTERGFCMLSLVSLSLDRGESRRVESSYLAWAYGWLCWQLSALWLPSLPALPALLCSGLAHGQHSDGIGASLAARAGAAAGACWEVSTLLSSTLCAALFWSGDSHLIACQQIVIVGISSPGQSQACATPPTVGATSLHIVIEKFNQIIS